MKNHIALHVTEPFALSQRPLASDIHLALSRASNTIYEKDQTLRIGVNGPTRNKKLTEETN